MKGLTLAVAVALSIFAGEAAADGLPSKSRSKDPGGAIPSWNGLHVGIGFGVAAFDHDLVPTEGIGFSGEGGGSFGTVTVGYDWMVRPGWVAGVFADYDFSDIAVALSFAGGGPPPFSLSVEHRHSWSVGARLGVVLDPSTLLYATAGYTRAEFEFSSVPPEIAEVLSSPRLDGQFVGAGIERLMHRSWALKLEYRFTQFGEDTVFSDGEVSNDHEASAHSARLVLSYRFGAHD